MWWGMGSQRRDIWTGASAIQASWCLILLVAMPWTSVATSVGNTEVAALHALRQALIDPSQVLSSWDPANIYPCSWAYVTCNSKNFVVRLDLGSAGLSGQLVSELGELSQLQYLEMYDNNIDGEIPPSLGNLKGLVSLDLYQNNFTGEIPGELGNLSQLRYLRLNQNHLTGEIPKSLTGLGNLQELDLSYNDLTGDIPMTGVFTEFSYQSFQGNPGLHYGAFFGPAQGPILSAPSTAGTLILLNLNSFALRLFMAVAVVKLAAALS